MGRQLSAAEADPEGAVSKTSGVLGPSLKRDPGSVSPCPPQRASCVVDAGYVVNSDFCSEFNCLMQRDSFWKKSFWTSGFESHFVRACTQSLPFHGLFKATMFYEKIHLMGGPH